MASMLEKNALRSKMEKFEGKINHMYLDSKGLVTVGVGHLLKNLGSAQKLKFKKAMECLLLKVKYKQIMIASKSNQKTALLAFIKGIQSSY